MDPAPLFSADRFLHHVDEGSDIMFGHGLSFRDTPEEGGIDLGGVFPAGLRVRGGTTPSFDHASTAKSFISSHMPSRVSSAKVADISGIG